MEILADPITVNCRKVLAGLKLMDADFTLTKIDYFQGQQKSPDYVAVNPNESLPALRDGEFILWESNAILTYVANKLGRHDVYPSCPVARADVDRWLFWESAHWFNSCYVYLVENCVKPLLGGAADPEILAGEADNFHKLASILDRRLRGGDWLCGDQVTLADIAVASAMHLHEWQQLPLERHANLRRWITESVEQLPAWKATHVEVGFKLPEAA